MFSFPADAISARNQTRREFIDYYIKLGYVLKNPEPLIPSDDNSLFFTGASIVGIKKDIRLKMEGRGYVLYQPCLRLHNLIGYVSADFNPPYLSYFHMLSIFANVRNTPNLSRDVLNYIKQIAGIPQNRLRIQTTSRLTFLDGYWGDNVSSILVDTQPSKYYDWSYGMQDVNGCGFTIEVETSPNYYEELGNVIEVYHKNEVWGYEFGFGIETFLSRKYSLRGPFETSLISQVIPFSDIPLNKHVQDLFLAASVIYGTGIRSGKSGVQAATRRTIVMLVRKLHQLNISDNEIAKIMFGMATIVDFGKESNLNDLISDLVSKRSQYEKLVHNFTDFVENQFRLLKQGRFKNQSDAIVHINKRVKDKYPIDPALVEQIINTQKSR